jgi:myo-inositol 2-dehydrogenase / D-chiro-inositol 1-dehydrogenase
MSQVSNSSRRDFLKTSGGMLVGSALAGAISSRSYAAEDNAIKIALVGCGSRGTGAVVNALSAQGPKRLFAMADVFQFRLDGSYGGIANEFAGQVDVPKERQFLGLDAYKQAIDAVAPGGVVFLATPPAFRPIHLEYAVAKGCHVFMEKSFAVDAPGIRRVLKAGEAAKQKNLKIAGGLMSRHYLPLEQAVEKIHGGAIGDVITCWAYRVHDPVGFVPKSPDMSELAHQIRNYSNFTWLNGTFLLDWLIHNLDVCCWVKDAWPIAAQGQGGRQQRQEPDQLFDHYGVEYGFPDGTRLFAQGRHMTGCWGFFGDLILGAKGAAILGEGISQPKLYAGHDTKPANMIWEYKGPPCNHYQREHELLFDAIRRDLPYNEAERCAKAAMTGIMGRMAAESGKLITWDDAMASNLELAPGLDQMTWDSNPPVLPDAQGKYPVAIPGVTQVL